MGKREEREIDPLSRLLGWAGPTNRALYVLSVALAVIGVVGNVLCGGPDGSGRARG